MKRVLSVLVCLALAACAAQRSEAARPRPNQGLPTVDYQVGRAYQLGQGIAVEVKNGGFEMSPPTSISINVHDLQSRRLLLAKSLNVPAMHPGQTRRVIVVPSSPRGVKVLGKIDPHNRVAETNEGNNTRSSKL